jgi:hypothetical protein
MMSPFPHPASAGPNFFSSVAASKFDNPSVFNLSMSAKSSALEPIPALFQANFTRAA